jgi:hypothetical protein
MSQIVGIRQMALLLAVAILSSAILCLNSAAQAPQKPWTKDQVIRMLKGDMPPKRVETLARERGIDFEMTSQTEGELRQAGADASLLSALRELAPKPREKQTEIVVQTSADAEIYVDDQFEGRASPEGRLKVAKLTPGEHVVRVALAGYRDLEEKIELKAGQTQQVNVRLVASAPPPASSGSTSTPSAAQTGPLNGFYSGNIENLTVNMSAKATVTLRESNGTVEGCLRVERPLFGSGPISGSEKSGEVSFQVSSPLVNIQGIGNVLSDSFSGTLTAHGANQASQQGRFALHRTNAPSVPSEAEVTNCPTETAQDVLNYAGSSQAISTFSVAHDHGSMNSYCVGLMTIGNGYIRYQSTTAAHSFSIPLNEIREVKRNGLYLVAIGGFHITPKSGRAVNFVVINSLGQYQSPDALLLAADGAMRANR